MDLHQQISQNYDFNYTKPISRIVVIALYPITSWYINDFFFKNNEQYKMGLLDSLQVLLLSCFFIQQLIVLIPVIDSKAEEIRLKTTDKNSAIYFVIFNILKLITGLWYRSKKNYFLMKQIQLLNRYSIRYCRIVLFMTNRKQILNIDKFGPTEKEAEEVYSDKNIGFLYGPITFDTLLLLVSLVYLFSAYTYSFVISKTNKLNTQHMLKYICVMIKIIYIIFLSGIAFFLDLNPTQLLFLLLLMFFVGNLMINARSKGEFKIKISSYFRRVRIFIIGFFIVISIVVCVSLNNSKSKRDPLPNLESKELRKIAKNDSKKQFFYMSICFSLINIYLYLKQLYKATQMDFFDVELAGDMGKYYLYISQWTEANDIKENSLTATYLGSNFFNVLRLRPDEVFTSSAAFKYQFVQTLIVQSRVLKKKLDSFQEAYIKDQNQSLQARIILSKILDKLKSNLFVYIKNSFLGFLLIIINIYSAFFFLFYIQKPNFVAFLPFLLLFWNIMSMVLDNQETIKYLTIFTIYPGYFLDFCSIGLKYLLESDSSFLNNDQYLKETISPYSSQEYFLLFLLITSYNFFAIINRETIRGSKNQRTKSLLGQTGSNSKFLFWLDKKTKNILVTTLKFVKMQFFLNFRIMVLIFAIFVSLWSINILNFILFLFAIFLIKMPFKDCSIWGAFMGYCFFMLTLKQIGNDFFPFDSFKVETVAILGLTSIDQQAQNTSRDTQMITLFVLCMLASFRYKFFSLSPKFEQETQKIHKNRLRMLKVKNHFVILSNFLLYMQYQFSKYILWIYHCLFNLILLYDYKDLASSMLFASETLCLFTHVILAPRASAKSSKIILLTWKINNFLVIVYLIVRYVIFFFKYSTLTDLFLGMGGFSDIAKQFFPNQVYSVEGEEFKGAYFCIQMFTCPFLLLTLIIVTQRPIEVDAFDSDNVDSNISKMKIAPGGFYFVADSGKSDKKVKDAKKESKNVDRTRLIDIQQSSGELCSSTVLGSNRIINTPSKEPSNKRPSNFTDVEFSMLNSHIQFATEQEQVFKKDKDTAHEVYRIVVGTILFLFMGGIYFYLCRCCLFKINLFKMLLIIVETVILLKVILDVLAAIEIIEMMEVCEKLVEYFYKRFFRAKKSSQIQNYISNAFPTKDDYLNEERFFIETYYQEAIELIFRALLKNSRYYWAVIFMPLLFYILFLYIIVYLNNWESIRSGNSVLVLFIKLMTFVRFSKDPQDEFYQVSNLEDQLLSLQSLLIALIVQFVFVHVFNEQLKVKEPSSLPVLKSLIKVIYSKYDYLIYGLKTQLDIKRLGKLYKAFSARKEELEKLLLEDNDKKSKLEKERESESKNANKSDLKGSIIINTDIIDLVKGYSNSKKLGKNPEPKIIEKNNNIGMLTPNINRTKALTNLDLKKLSDFQINSPGSQKTKTKNSSYLDIFKDSDQKQVIRSSLSIFNSVVPSMITPKNNLITSQLIESEDGNGDSANPKQSEKSNSNNNSNNWLFNIMTRTGDNSSTQEDDTLRVYLSETTDSEYQLFFFWINRYKFKTYKVLVSFLNSICLFNHWPMLILLTYPISPERLIICFYFIRLAFKQRLLFTVHLRHTLVVYFLYFTFTLMILFTVRMEKIFNFGILDSVRIKSSDKNIKEDSFKYRVLRAIQRAYEYDPRSESMAYLLSYNSLWITLVLISFSICPIILRYTTIQLFQVTIPQKRQFHSYLFSRTGKRYLTLNFKKWVNQPLKIVNFIYKYAMTETYELFNLLHMLVLLSFRELNVFALGLILLYNMIFWFIEHNNKMNTQKNIFKDKNLKRQQFANNSLLKSFSRFFVMYLALILVSIFVTFTLSLFEYNPESLNRILITPGSPDLALLLICLLFRDLASSNKYLQTRESLIRQSALKRKYASICSAYEFNEKKLMDRIVKMLSKHSLDNITEKLLFLEEGVRSEINLEYLQGNIHEKFDEAIDAFTTKKLGTFSAMYIKLKRKLCKFLVNNSYMAQSFDFLYVISIMRERNHRLNSLPSKISLDKYISNKYDTFERELINFELEYELLRGGDHSQKRKYEIAIQSNMRSFDNQIHNTGVLIGRARSTRSNHIKKINNVINVNYSEVRNERLQGTIFGQKESSYSGYSSAAHIPKKHLTAASNLVFDILTRIDDKSKQTNLETHKNVNQKNGYIYCTYKNNQVILYNIQENVMEATMGYNQLGTKLTLNLCIWVLVNNVEPIMIFALISTEIFNGGILNFLIIGIILFLILIEENLGRSYWWNVLYIFYFGLAGVKICFGDSKLFGLTPSEILQNSNNFYAGSASMFYFLFGNLRLKILIVLPIALLMENLKRKGLYSKTFSGFENPGAAITRLILNEDMIGMLERECNKASKMNELYMGYILEKGGRTLNKVDFAKIKLESVKLLIEHYSYIQEFKYRCLPVAKVLMIGMKNEIFSLHHKCMDKFFFRNFSFYLRKIGGCFFWWICYLLLFINVYILVLFPYLNNSEVDRKTHKVQEHSLTNSSSDRNVLIPRFVVFNVLFYTTTLFVEYVFFKMQTHDFMGYRNASVTTRLLKKVNFDRLSTTKPNTPKQVFYKAVRLVINIYRIAQAAKKKQYDSYKDNPEMFHYFYLIIVWVYCNYTTYFMLPFVLQRFSKFYLWREIFIKAGYINPDNEDTRKQSAQLVVSRDQSLIVLGFYSLNICYITLAILQIRGGKSFNLIKKKKTPIILKKLKYHIYHNLSLIKSGVKVLEFLAVRTCLRFTDFLLLVDLQQFMDYARLKNVSQSRNPVGRKVPNIKKLPLFLTFLLVILSMFILPLFIYTNFYISEAINIKSFDFQINLRLPKSHNGQKLINIFHTDILLVHESLKPSKDSKNPTNSPSKVNVTDEEKQDMLKMLYQVDKLNYYYDYQFKLIRMASRSDSFLMVPPKMMENLKEIIIQDNQAHLEVLIQVEVEDNSNPKVETRKVYKIDGINLVSLLNILNRRCDDPNYRSKLEFFMGFMPKLLIINGKDIIRDSSIENNSMKIGLARECGSGNLTYISLPEDTKQLEFQVITQKRKGKFTLFGFTITYSFFSLRTIYSTVIVVFGLRVVRRMLFGKTPKTWFERIPKTEIMFILLDAIDYARQENDMLKEELIYLLMVDIFRNPHELKKLTDSTLECRLDQFYRQLMPN